MARDARRDPSQPDEQERLPSGEKRRPTLPFGIPAVRPGMKLNDTSARGRTEPMRPTPRPPPAYAEELPMRRDTPVGKRLGGFAPEPEDERFLEQLAADLRPQLAWLLGDRRDDFHRELSEGHLDVALEMLLEDRRANPRNVSATKAAHAMREAIRDHVRNRVGPMNAVPFLVREPPVAARSYVRVLPLINGVSTIEDIIGSCQLPMLETIRALSRLHKVGCIELPGIDLPALVPRRGRALAAEGVEHRERSEEDRGPASSRLTMPEILAPFAADLEALGVGDADAPAVSGEHPVARPPHEDPLLDVRAPRTKTSISDPTTPIPDGDGALDAPRSERGHERRQVVARGASLGEATAPAERIAERDHHDDTRAERAETADAGVAGGTTRENDQGDAEPASQPVVDPALDELGAIWRKRANRKSETPPRSDGAAVVADAAPGASPSPLAPSDEGARDDPDRDAGAREVRPRLESARSLPSIPALDPPLAAELAYDEVAPVSRSRAAPAANVRFVAIVAALAGLVIVAMIALRVVRSAPPSEPRAEVGTSAAPTEPAKSPAVPPPVTPASPADTAPSFIERGTVTYTIKVTPKYARVFLDDVLLVPVGEVKLRREDKDHVLRVEAPGFGTRELTVSARSDASLVVALDKAPDARTPPPAAPRSAAPKAPPKAGSSAAPGARAQPYPE